MNTTSANLRADADSLRRNADTLDEMARTRRGTQDEFRFRAQADAKRAEANELDDRAQQLQRNEFLAESYDQRADALWAKTVMTERDVAAAQAYRDRAFELRHGR